MFDSKLHKTKHKLTLSSNFKNGEFKGLLAQLVNVSGVIDMVWYEVSSLEALK